MAVTNCIDIVNCNIKGFSVNSLKKLKHMNMNR